MGATDAKLAQVEGVPVMSTDKIDMWLDDERPAPEGWTLVKTTWEAIALLKAGRVRRASLDQDLGLCSPCERREAARKDLNTHPTARNCTCMTGYKLCLWMADNEKWPDEKPTVHSANPPGVFAMRAVIDRYFPICGEEFVNERGVTERCAMPKGHPQRPTHPRKNP